MTVPLPITALPQAPSVDADARMVIVQDGQTQQCFVSDVRAASTGTFTPTLIGSSVPGVQTYSRQSGLWRRQGPAIVVSGRVTLTAKDGAMAGNALIGGLPVAAINDADLLQAIVVGYMDGVTYPGAGTWIGGFVIANSQLISLKAFRSASAALDIPVGNVSAAADIAFAATYLVE